MKPNFPNPPGPAPHTPMVYVHDRWQYKVVTRDVPLSLSEEELNTLGKEGWELTAVLTHGRVTSFYFKRMKD